MKKYLLIISLVLLAFGSMMGQTQKFGYVDSQIILTQFPAAIKAQGDLDALTNLWLAQVDSMSLAYQQALADYQKQVGTMNDTQKQAKQQELITMEQTILEFRNKKFNQQNGEIYIKQEQIFDPVKKKIYAAIEQVAKDEGMHFVLDKSGDVIVLYADEAFDITFKVLDKLKRGN